MDSTLRTNFRSAHYAGLFGLSISLAMSSATFAQAEMEQKTRAGSLTKQRAAVVTNTKPSENKTTITQSKANPAAGVNTVPASSPNNKTGSNTNVRTKAAKFFGEGKYAQAVSAAQEAINQNPEDMAAIYCQAIAYQQMHLFRIAEEELQECLQANPNNLDAKLALAQCWSNDGKLSKAVEYLEGLQKQFPKNADVIYNLAFTYRMYGDVNAWDAAARQAVELDPKREDSWKLLIRALLTHFDFSYAEKNAEIYLQKFPNKPGPYMLTIQGIYLVEERFGEIAVLLDQARRNHALAPSDYEELAKQFREMAVITSRRSGRKSRVDHFIYLMLEEKTLKYAHEIAPKDLSCSLQLATNLVAQNKRREAAPLVRQVLDALPTNPQALDLAPLVFTGKGDIAGRLKDDLRRLFKNANASAANSAKK